jgi:hypothetical protein
MASEMSVALTGTGNSATRYQRTGTRQRTLRRPRSTTPSRPASAAVTKNAPTSASSTLPEIRAEAGRTARPPYLQSAGSPRSGSQRKTDHHKRQYGMACDDAEQCRWWMPTSAPNEKSDILLWPLLHESLRSLRQDQETDPAPTSTESSRPGGRPSRRTHRLHIPYISVSRRPVLITLRLSRQAGRQDHQFLDAGDWKHVRINHGEDGTNKCKHPSRSKSSGKVGRRQTPSGSSRDRSTFRVRQSKPVSVSRTP